MKPAAKRALRRNLLLLALALCLLGGYLYSRHNLIARMSGQPPVITFDQEQLSVSVAVTDAELLAGVTALDDKDGDVSGDVVIESISNLLDDHVRIITYAAFDGDNQVGKAQRRLQYTDYTPIRFSLSAPLGGSYNDWTMEGLLAPLSASDCIDGDLTRSIVVAERTWGSSSGDVQIMTAHVQVTNSCGEVADLALPIPLAVDDSLVRSRNGFISLSQYLVYHPADTPFNPAAYLTEAVAGREEDVRRAVTIENPVDVNVPGVYVVTYSFALEDPEAYASTDLIVVVE